MADTSWIQPGKAAWDWWSGSYAKDVKFEPGMNTATMKHYIDFAAARQLEYMLVDAGWCPSGKAERSEDILNYPPGGEHPRNHRLRQAEGREDVCSGSIGCR